MDEKEAKDKDRDADRALDLKELCSVWGPFEADVVKSFLESNGIRCLIRGRMVPCVYPFTVDGLAEFKVFVGAGDFETAKALLETMPPAEGESGPDEPR
jgi:hypothetical protein